MVGDTDLSEYGPKIRRFSTSPLLYDLIVNPRAMAAAVSTYKAFSKTVQPRNLSPLMHVLSRVLHLLNGIASAQCALGRSDVTPRSEGGASTPTHRRASKFNNSQTTIQHLPVMAAHNIVVFAGDHCGPEVSFIMPSGFFEFIQTR